jgi:hypothetical protein
MSDTTGRRRAKHLILDHAKLRRAQKILGAKTETETVERALDFVIGEDERSRRASAAHDRFMRAALREGLLIYDAYGRVRGEIRKGVN